MTKTTVTFRADFKNLSHRRFGDLTVLRPVGRHYSPSGQSQVLYLCACACGRKTTLHRGSLLRNTHCIACARDPERRSVRLADGRTLVGIARDAGLKLSTVQKRWKRGWPVEKLALPLQPKDRPPKRYGGSRVVR